MNIIPRLRLCLWLELGIAFVNNVQVSALLFARLDCLSFFLIVLLLNDVNYSVIVWQILQLYLLGLKRFMWLIPKSWSFRSLVE